MPTPTLLLAAVLFAADDKDFQPFVFGGKAPDPVSAGTFDRVRDGMTLRELAAVVGPGYVPELSGTGHIRWTCEDGRTLTASHVKDPNAVLTAKGKGTEQDPWIKMRDKNGKVVEMPAKPKPYTDEEAGAFVKRAEELRAEVNAGKRKAATTLEGALAELKIDPKRLTGLELHVGNATDWHVYRLSPGYKLTAAYTQQAPPERAFRSLWIEKVTPAKKE